VLAGLAQFLGHERLRTTAQFTKRMDHQLGEAVDRLNYWASP
jgi:hypothetical protein